MRMVLRLLAALVLCVTTASAQPQEMRVALVIGNSAYSAVQRLDNPTRDAALVHATLQRAGFQSDIRTDLTKPQFEAELRAFSRKVARAEVALVYYAGHGIQLEQENWLLPIDAQLALPTDARAEAVRLEDVIAFVGGARKLRIVILDACRDNPFSLRFASSGRAIRRGLAPIEGLPGGTVVAFAAGPGQQASDRPNAGGDNSPYAAALARRMLEPGVELSQMLRRVRGDVLRDAAPQEPWANESRLDEDFYFVAASAGAPAAADPEVERLRRELEALRAAAAGGDAASLAAKRPSSPNTDRTEQSAQPPSSLSSIQRRENWWKGEGAFAEVRMPGLPPGTEVLVSLAVGGRTRKGLSCAREDFCGELERLANTARGFYRLSTEFAGVTVGVVRVNESGLLRVVLPRRLRREDTGEMIDLATVEYVFSIDLLNATVNGCSSRNVLMTQGRPSFSFLPAERVFCARSDYSNSR